MTKSSAEFMLHEYVQIASAFFNLWDKINEWFKTYLALFGLPLTVLTAILAVGGTNANISLFALPDVVAGLLLVVSLLGLFVGALIVTMRMEMILYARTINNVRRYFASTERSSEEGRDVAMADFLVLPTSDTKPPFYEPWKATFWQVLFVGFLDSLMFFMGLANLVRVPWFYTLLLSLLYLLAHWIVYRLVAGRRETKWKILHEDDIQTSNF